MKVDPTSHIPIFLQIAAGVSEAIAAGIFRPGDALPSLREMALRVQVNPNTVQRAYDHLAREGTVFSRRGKGLFVAEQAVSSAQAFAEQAVRDDFGRGIQRGRTVGLNDGQIREIFEATFLAQDDPAQDNLAQDDAETQP